MHSSHIIPNLPPALPVKAIVFIPLAFATNTVYKQFLELPDVDKTISVGRLSIKSIVLVIV